jgi:hypothetical protein
MSDFYIGYLPRVPHRLGLWIRRVILALNGLAILIAILLVLVQMPFADSRFEFLQYRSYTGTLIERPYPTLLTSDGGLLLVAPGKHGAEPLVRGLDQRSVQLQGSLIQRAGDRMLELLPDSVRPAGGKGIAHDQQSLAMVKLTGEIVDSKCYLGVMNPGNGKVHRDCAVRCISGGIPPALAVRDARGTVQLILLTSHEDGALSDAVLDKVAEPVEISGELIRVNGKLMIRTDPSTISRQIRRE